MRFYSNSKELQNKLKMKVFPYMLLIWLLTLFSAPLILLWMEHPEINREFWSVYVITMTSNILLSIPTYLILISVLYLSPDDWANPKVKIVLSLVAVYCIFISYLIHDTQTLNPASPMFRWPLLHCMIMVLLIFVLPLKRNKISFHDA